MLFRFRRPLFRLVFLILALLPAAADEQPKAIRVLIQTEKGDVEVELDAARAPLTVANFLRYVDGKFYDGGRFHRTVKPDNQPDSKVKIEVIQAGINPKRSKEELPPIKLERTRDTQDLAQGRNNLDGARRSGHGDFRFLHLHRRPARA